MSASRFDELTEERLRRRPGLKWQRYGPEVLPAWVADMDYPIPSAVRDALSTQVELGDLGYPGWLGRGSPLRVAFADRMSQRYGWQPEPSKVRELTDIIQGLQLALTLGTEAGDPVAMLTPSYPPFLETLRQMGRPLVAIPLEDDGGQWRFDAERAEHDLAATSCRALVLVNPHNPTGRMLDRTELSALAEIAERHDLLVIADEVHAELSYEGRCHLPFAAIDPSLERRCVTLTSATKAFNLAGIRCALAHFGPPELLERRDRAPFALYGEPSSLGVVATLAAWTGGDGWREEVVAYLDGNRRRLGERLAAELPAVRHLPPEATYLAWLDLSAAGLGDDPAPGLLASAKVALSRGVDFGPEGAGFVRLNFATSRPVLDEILDRLVRAIAAPA